MRGRIEEGEGVGRRWGCFEEFFVSRRSSLVLFWIVKGTNFFHGMRERNMVPMVVVGM